jgi:hypothetical protein
MGRKYDFKDVNTALPYILLILNEILVLVEFGLPPRFVTALAAKHAGMAVFGLAPAPIPL